MKVFVDEDTGSSVGKALEAIGVEAFYVSASKHSIIKSGDGDDVWLPIAGRNGWLVLTRNIRIIENEAERELVISERVGMVFLPQHLSRFELLRLILKKWDWLKAIDATVPRPFAFSVNPIGRTRRIDPIGPPVRARRQRT